METIPEVRTVMRKSWQSIIPVVILAGALGTAAEKADFSGTWIHEPDKNQTDTTTPKMREITTSINGMPVERSETDREELPEPSPAAMMQNLVLHIAQTGDELGISRTFSLFGRNQTILQKFLLDGSQCLNLASDARGEFESRTTWEKKNLVHSGIETVTDGPQRLQIYVAEEYSLSKDRKKLTIKTRSATPKGSTRLKQVFRRKE